MTKDTEVEIGTCALCGQELLRAPDDCWHPYNVARACPPEPAGGSMAYSQWVSAGNRTGRPGPQNFRPIDDAVMLARGAAHGITEDVWHRWHGDAGVSR